MKRTVIGWLLAGSLLTGCGERLESAWREPAADGTVDWAGVPFHREQTLEIGFANDADHLYVCLYPVDSPQQMILMRQGATVWQGRTAMRISVSSWATTEDDVEQSLAAMIRVAAQVTGR